MMSSVLWTVRALAAPAFLLLACAGVCASDRDEPEAAENSQRVDVESPAGLSVRRGRYHDRASNETCRHLHDWPRGQGWCSNARGRRGSRGRVSRGQHPPRSSRVRARWTLVFRPNRHRAAGCTHACAANSIRWKADGPADGRRAAGEYRGDPSADRRVRRAAQGESGVPERRGRDAAPGTANGRERRNSRPTLV